VRRLIVLLLLLAACNLSLEGGVPAGGFIFYPQEGCYYKMVVTGESDSYDYDFDALICPGDWFETFSHPYGTYLVELYRADGEVVEIEVVLNRFQVPIGDL
jgi:hypothetical protein